MSRLWENILPRAKYTEKDAIRMIKTFGGNKYNLKYANLKTAFQTKCYFCKSHDKCGHEILMVKTADQVWMLQQSGHHSENGTYVLSLFILLNKANFNSAMFVCVVTRN